MLNKCLALLLAVLPLCAQVTLTRAFPKSGPQTANVAALFKAYAAKK